MRVLDLFCKQGGATRGYQQLGFHVTGVDIEPQPRYCGDDFEQLDALDWLRGNKWWIQENVALIHASPPCQAYSLTHRIQSRRHPRLIAPLRFLLEETGVAYVIENVEDARDDLVDPVTLCAAPFGMRTYRHRLFETGHGLTLKRPEHPEHTAPLAKMGRPRRPGEFAHYVGNFSGVEEARQDLGVPWMNRDGIRECIPPAYTRWIGEQFIAQTQPDAA